MFLATLSYLTSRRPPWDREQDDVLTFKYAICSCKYLPMTSHPNTFWKLVSKHYFLPHFMIADRKRTLQG